MKQEAMFYTWLYNGAVRCDLCAHHCVIEDQDYGFCNVRQNISEGLKEAARKGKIRNLEGFGKKT